jgi:SAM-dependent methyltransferase
MTSEAVRAGLSRVKIALRPRGKMAFLQTVCLNGKLLDVGCGSDSPFRAKMQRHDIYYIGLDVDDYNHGHDPRRYADRYILTTPERFADEIASFANTVDGVVSSHNIEHCSEPQKVLNAMLATLKPGGRIYLSFPCEESVRFPRRGGCLNFYDDPTHTTPPVYRDLIETIAASGFKIEFAAKRYRPIIPAILGLLLEPISILSKRIMPGLTTWALYGFESIIWASRPSVLDNAVRAAEPKQAREARR